VFMLERGQFTRDGFAKLLKSAAAPRMLSGMPVVMRSR
jgi:hypothetical protein